CWPSSTNVNEGCVDKKPVFIPNPSTGIFMIGIPTPSTTVYTSTGQQVWKGTGNTIDLSSQPPGVYTAVVATERGRQAVRLVVVR
nr:T9SS type A sorting domain-containing protein [Flavobacteriales bacterium]